MVSTRQYYGTAVFNSFCVFVQQCVVINIKDVICQSIFAASLKKLVFCSNVTPLWERFSKHTLLHAAKRKYILPHKVIF